MVPWYKSAVIYELHVRSFCDSDGDGVGDFAGLTSKLDYFKDLGITAIWLLPFYPSPLRDDGYDIADYRSINPAYGTMEDFQSFLDGAHQLGLRVITELVVNHTSDAHEWFRRARRAPPGSPERNFYVWNDTPERYEDARVIFKDFETSNWAWDPVAQAYYWHRFYAHQPDLNYDNPAVRRAVLDVVDFWLGRGVDGMRLDAVPYLIEREGTSCENLPETHECLRELRAHVDAKFPGSMLLAEANQWPEDAAKYFGEGDECHMVFHFPLMPRLFMALQMEDRFPITDILDQTPEIPQTSQWAIFLRNHDELTLEMVTDEERDYMYRLYAEEPRTRINLGIRRRLAPLLNNNRRKIELLNALLFSLPGTPIIYYGDEIGMGDNFYLGDRNGVRTPMQWSADRNAGFSRANPQQLFLPVIIDPEFHYEAVNVDVQAKNVSSLFWWMRRLITARQQSGAMVNGTFEFVHPANAKVLAYIRRTEDETMLVVANLSRFPQSVRLDLSEFRGSILEELFGGAQFAEIGESPVFLTVGPHGFYWLQILPRAPVAAGAAPPEQILIPAPSTWSDELLNALEKHVLARYLPGCRWFGHKDQRIRFVRIAGTFSAPGTETQVILAEVMFVDGAMVRVFLALHIGEEGESEFAGSVRVGHFADGRVLWDAMGVSSFRRRLWSLIVGGTVWGEANLRIEGRPAAPLDAEPGPSLLIGGEHSNSNISFDERYLLKIFRSLEFGTHPETELLQVLSERGFKNAPPYLGSVRLRMEGSEGTLGILTSYQANQGDGWSLALDALSQFFERVISSEVLMDAAGDEDGLIGTTFPERMRQLGERTGELHACLAGVTDIPEFAPEYLTPFSQRSLYQSMRNALRRTEDDVRRRLPSMDKKTKRMADRWLAMTPAILDRYALLLGPLFEAVKIRVHGDLHLGQMLNTGNDFIFVDFEGEPRKSLTERRLKRSPWVDVAGMMRSLDYAAEASLLRQKGERRRLRPWVDRWLAHVSEAYCTAYETRCGALGFHASTAGRSRELLQLFLLDKMIYEVGYEISYRPHFLPIPLSAIRRLLGHPAKDS